jgi:hypothetical protein
MSPEGQRHEPISTHFPEKALSSDHENVSTALVQQSLKSICDVLFARSELLHHKVLNVLLISLEFCNEKKSDSFGRSCCFWRCFCTIQRDALRRG